MAVCSESIALHRSMSGSSENEEGAEASDVLEEPERPIEWTSGWDDECNDVEDDPDPHGAWNDRGNPVGKCLKDTRASVSGPMWIGLASLRSVLRRRPANLLHIYSGEIDLIYHPGDLS